MTLYAEAHRVWKKSQSGRGARKTLPERMEVKNRPRRDHVIMFAMLHMLLGLPMFLLGYLPCNISIQVGAASLVFDLWLLQYFLKGVSLTMWTLAILVLVGSFSGCVPLSPAEVTMLSLFLIGLELVAAFTGMALAQSARVQLRDLLRLMLYEHDITPDFRSLWSNVQKAYRCCGVDGYRDWVSRNRTVPPACCQDDDYLFPRFDYREKGCLAVLGGILDYCMFNFRTILFFSILFQTFWIIFHHTIAYLNRPKPIGRKNNTVI